MCSVRVVLPAAWMLLSPEDAHRWSVRDSEVTLLLERWEQVKAGHGHVVLLMGEAGIGKSRLVEMLKDHVAHEPHVRWSSRDGGTEGLAQLGHSLTAYRATGMT